MSGSKFQHVIQHVTLKKFDGFYQINRITDILFFEIDRTSKVFRQTKNLVKPIKILKEKERQ